MYGIARSHVETHAHLAATPTVCPGRHFPIERLLPPSPALAMTRQPPPPCAHLLANGPAARSAGLLSRPLS